MPKYVQTQLGGGLVLYLYKAIKNEDTEGPADQSLSNLIPRSNYNQHQMGGLKGAYQA